MADVLVIFFGVLMVGTVQVHPSKQKYALTLSAVKDSHGSWNTAYTLRKWNPTNDWTIIVQQNATGEEETMTDPCNLPKAVGPCGGSFEQWYYDKRRNSCHSFEYSGCQGNRNRFNDRKSCERRCQILRADETPATVKPDSATTRPVEDNGIKIPGYCTDDPFARCDIAVKHNFCSRQPYTRICCRTCALNGQPHRHSLQLDGHEHSRYQHDHVQT